MGNSESSRKKQQRKELLEQIEKEEKKTRPLDTKKILLLHKSNGAQLQITRYFRDALIVKSNESVCVTNFVNIADGKEIPKSPTWLDELNSVVLICLTSESIEEFGQVILEKGFSDENGHLHPKVFTISFGESLTSVWPPKGLKKGSRDLRDFYFGFSDVENLRAQDFKKSLRLNSLIAAMKDTK
ncbi:uncharacterized protein LOC122948348 [Acropora millepora]|uniref:uncharacterized protein LOC122948348 n=1 Tax=Acropora millepora TaxID=45264 RepID=UPI001CF10490|nr:uncharacterized protein LOC122948348 [Acropora millepora]